MERIMDINYGIATAPIEGEIECGDQYLIKKMDQAILLAVVDGLGHGIEAAVAAKSAINILAQSKKNDLSELLLECHRSLKITRGAAIKLILILPSPSCAEGENVQYQISWLSIGNVLGLHWRKDMFTVNPEILCGQSGIVGMELPAQLKINEFMCNEGDILIVATDGIMSQFTDLRPVYYAPQALAEYIFNNYRNVKDDALILVTQVKNYE